MNPEKNLVVLACCQAVPDIVSLTASLQGAGVQPRVIPEPCSSKVEAYHLLRILATGVDLVWVIGCPENYCQLVEGSSRMGRRVAHAQNYLGEIGLEPERLGLSRINAGDKSALATVVAEIQARAQALTPNPVRPVSSL